MTNEQLEKSIERNRKRIMRLRTVEERARALQSRLDATRAEWERLHTQVRSTDEWEQYCFNNGIAIDYNFGDLLC